MTNRMSSCVLQNNAAPSVSGNEHQIREHRFGAKPLSPSHRPLRRLRHLAVVLLGIACIGRLAGVAEADPCGMVPPIYIAGDVPIERIGVQKTYVFYKDGIETIVIRPGFSGKVDEFGMLIPFPTVPAIRKVPDNIFGHIAAAIDPPEVVVHVRFANRRGGAAFGGSFGGGEEGMGGGLAFRDRDAVRLVKQEAVGMYEVAVLEAGSAAALKKWIEEHGYKFPKGMDQACNDYLEDGWCFVAVKTKVGRKQGVQPSPGLRAVDSKLPSGAIFDGHVQAMGFRFRVDELVVPMRLSTFNAGDLHNIVYVLTEGPSRIRSLRSKYIVRQIPGIQLLWNVTDPLPLRIIGGAVKDIQPWQKRNLAQRRNPLPHNGAARDLFASDLLAAKRDRLVHRHEETEKMLLRIGERLGLRGPQIDRLNEQSLSAERNRMVKLAFKEIKLKEIITMTLTVIDGNFPRKLLANQNLRFAPYRMPWPRNRAQIYDAKQMGPALKQRGTVTYGKLSFKSLPSDESQQRASAVNSSGPRSSTISHRKATAPFAAGIAWALISGLFIAAAVGVRRRAGKKTMGLLLLAGLAFGLFGMMTAASAQEKPKAAGPTTLQLIDRLGDPNQADRAAEALIARGSGAYLDLMGEALEGSNMVVRGWSIVCLSEIGGAVVKQDMVDLARDVKQPMLVRTWAAAARVQMATSSDELLQLAGLVSQFPAVSRPFVRRLAERLSEKGEAITAEHLLNITLQVPQFQQTLASAILAEGANTLVQVMVTAQNQNIRRQAAAYLGTLANQGNRNVPSAVVAVYKFNPQAKQVPWQGGPLFVPALKWTKNDARALVGNLIAWHLWCERNNQKRQQTQIDNNLRSVQLAAAAGYQSVGFGQVGTKEWLSIWGRAAGKTELEKLLKAQGAESDPRYRRILRLFR